MMPHISHILDALSRLISYPDKHTVQTAELVYVALVGELPEAAREASTFGAFVDQHELWELEEAYARVFDINPACSLEVGWHLFGEEYARGMFLVRMREELRKYGLSESKELPDHITHVLAIVAAMPEDEAARFVRACVQPAVEKMRLALEDQQTPYAHVVNCLAAVIEDTWGPAAPPSEDRPFDLRRPVEQDPLHAFPVADVSCGGCDSGAPADLVPLQMNFPTELDQVDGVNPNVAPKGPEHDSPGQRPGIES